jgi:hypothetical protein
LIKKINNYCNSTLTYQKNIKLEFHSDLEIPSKSKFYLANLQINEFNKIKYKNNAIKKNILHYLCVIIQNIILFTKMSTINKSPLLKYLMPAVAIGVFTFLMIGYGSAYTPPKAQKQSVICFKFKNGTSESAIKKHIEGFQDLKRELKEISSYSAGRTFEHEGSSNEYDVMHYLTFRTDEEIENFKKSTQYQAFTKSNEANWDKVLIINSEIK